MFLQFKGYNACIFTLCGFFGFWPSHYTCCYRVYVPFSLVETFYIISGVKHNGVIAYWFSQLSFVELCLFYCVFRGNFLADFGFISLLTFWFFNCVSRLLSLQFSLFFWRNGYVLWVIVISHYGVLFVHEFDAGW